MLQMKYIVLPFCGLLKEVSEHSQIQVPSPRIRVSNTILYFGKCYPLSPKQQISAYS